MSRVADLVAGAGDGRRGRGGGVAVGGEHVAGDGAVDNLCNSTVQYSTVQHVAGVGAVDNLCNRIVSKGGGRVNIW